jgi:hypothetical protein
MTMKKVVRMSHLQKMKMRVKDCWSNSLIKWKKDGNECACSEKFKFLFHSLIFSLTFDFKCVINILLF